MKFTLSWLKTYLDTEASAQEICERLTAIGLELESFEDPAEKFAPFKVAYVESAAPHPDADKLQVLKVVTEGNAHLQVVCGAPNARAGMKGVFAPEGTYIPGLDVTLKKTKIRGVESNGMMVSEKEMCLSEDHKGIIEVDDSYEIGTPMVEVFGLNDPVIEIGLTPNRADCAGIYGIARDLAAAGLGTLKPLDLAIEAQSSFPCPVSVKIEDQDGCPHFAGRLIQNVKNGPSPDWLQSRLKAVGLRPISALVDITNFIALGFARPLHVYDADKLNGGISVRASQKGEKLDALNDKSYDLIDGAVGIYDGSGLIGLGGIVGGVSTGSESDTVNVFVEAAYFNPMRIARAGRDLGILSDARYRFERGVDPEFTLPGLELATKMILELCGTEKSAISEVVQGGAPIDWTREIPFNPAYCEKLSGIHIEENRQREILSHLGFEMSTTHVTPPSWRGDVEGPSDLVEEIIRIEGLDALPAISVSGIEDSASPVETQTLSRTRKARAAMAVRGLDECVTWSFMPSALAVHFGSNDNPALKLSNPISADLDQMRPSILPNLLAAAVRAQDKALGDVAFCEIGPVFDGTAPSAQPIMAAGLRTGALHERHWSGTEASRGVDAYDAKADALAVLEACGAMAANAAVTRSAPSYYHPGRSGAIAFGKNVLAYFGELHPSILQEMELKSGACAFEIFLQNIPESRKKEGHAKSLLTLPNLQPVRKDFAFIVDEAVSADELLRAAKAGDKNLIDDAFIFDVYRGKGVDAGKKSVAICVTLQPKDQTLDEEALSAVMKSIIDTVAKKVGGALRG